MNKFFIVLLILGAGALAYLLLGQEPESGADILNEEVDYEQVEDYLKEETSNSIVGSCNSIAEASSCIEYRGSIWGDNDMARLNCEGSGEFSTNGCPYNAHGGCQTSGGTNMEMVVWMYPQGGGEIDEEALPYAIAACDANPMATWISQE